MPPAHNKRPSMVDVGLRANVSAQTVSRYFRGGYVSSDKRERVEAAVRELGYRQNRLPINMRSEFTETIGFLMLGPLNYGNAGVFSGLSRAARLQHQTLVTSHIETDPASSDDTWAEVLRIIDGFISMRVDGLVITTPYVGVDRLVKHVGEAVPLLAAVESADKQTSLVYADSYAAARLAVRHLVELGHRDVLHVAGPVHRIQSCTRRQAYLDELADAGLTPLPIVECEEWDAASGAKCAEMVDPCDFTAVFAANDEIALGFSRVLRLRGFEAPKDYSIVGFDDMPEARYFTPPLTTMHLDFERIGEAALGKILGLIRGEDPGVSDPMEVPLIVRDSTAPRPRS